MDNIQFWIYVIFAIIYFVARNFKKADKNQQPARPPRRSGEAGDTFNQPQSFEELLEEITGRKSIRKEVEEEELFDFEPGVERYQQPKPWEEKERERELRNEFEREGRNRQFADAESRRVYEESIKLAEGAVLDYGVDEKYASKKVIRETAEEKKQNMLAAEIKDMLSNSQDARKAVILSEILQRRY